MSELNNNDFHHLLRDGKPNLVRRYIFLAIFMIAAFSITYSFLSSEQKIKDEHSRLCNAVSNSFSAMKECITNLEEKRYRESNPREITIRIK